MCYDGHGGGGARALASLMAQGCQARRAGKKQTTSVSAFIWDLCHRCKSRAT